MLCGDPAQGDVTSFSGYPQDKVSPISCPDNVAFDSAGNRWISTGGAEFVVQVFSQAANPGRPGLHR